MRRNYNAKRRYLSFHGDFLCQEASNIVNDIDCNMLAKAFDASNNTEKAEKYWELAVSKSPNATIQHANLRGFARYKFRQGNAPQGRALYNRALELPMPDNDVTRQIVSDTYLLWAATEKELGSSAECTRLFDFATNAAKRIGSPQSQKYMLEQINEQRTGGVIPELPPPSDRQFGGAP
jgi:tetratricopeptide (TPR) repeat protein